MDYGTLYDYDTATPLRPATRDELRATLEAGSAGVFSLNGESVYVDGEDEEARNACELEQIESLEGLMHWLRSDDRSERVWCDLPNFGGEAPVHHCGVGVWSWDEERVLVGDCASELEIMSRDEWAED